MQAQRQQQAGKEKNMNMADVPAIGEAATNFRTEDEYTEQKHAPHANQYFVMGNNKIIINEHFKNDGKPLEFILKKVILDAGKYPETA